MRPNCAVPAATPLPVRDRVVFVEGNQVYVWPFPKRTLGDRLHVRRLALDQPVRVPSDSPRFGGLDEDEELRPATRRVQADRLRRLHTRAVLFATPETLCSTQDIADVFGIAEGDVRASRPISARRIGRAWMAPFADWLVALHINLDAMADESDAPRRRPIRDIEPPTLRPLGGPTHARGAR